MTPLAHLKVNKMKAKSIINQYKHTNDYFFDYFFLLHCMRQLRVKVTFTYVNYPFSFFYPVFVDCFS